MLFHLKCTTHKMLCKGQTMYTNINSHNFLAHDTSGSKNYHYEPFNQMFIFCFQHYNLLWFINFNPSKFLATDLIQVVRSWGLPPTYPAKNHPATTLARTMLTATRNNLKCIRVILMNGGAAVVFHYIFHY